MCFSGEAGGVFGFVDGGELGVICLVRGRFWCNGEWCRKEICMYFLLVFRFGRGRGRWISSGMPVDIQGGVFPRIINMYYNNKSKLFHIVFHT